MSCLTLSASEAATPISTSFLLTPPLESFESFAAQTRALQHAAYQPHFRSCGWCELDSWTQRHDWLVKDFLVKGEKSIMGGASQSGKSFEALSLAMAVARGINYHGRRVHRAGVIYVAGESAPGLLGLRLPAYRKHHHLAAADSLPLRVIADAPNFFAGDTDCDHLIADILHHAEGFSHPLGLVILDTYAALTPGAREIAVEDVTLILRRIDRLREKTGAHVMIAHHMNAEGTRLRGHTAFRANVDCVVEISMAEEGKAQNGDTPKIDADGRPIRLAVIEKQKDGACGLLGQFVLRRVELGSDADGEIITSCISAPPAEQRARAKDAQGRLILRAREKLLFHALMQALTLSEPAPVGVAPSRARCVRLDAWRAALIRIMPENNAAALKQIPAAADRFKALGLIALNDEWIWRTPARVDLDD